jgi:hypothetical protein
MPRCTFCHHENPAGADRCTSCGAALTTIDESREDQQPQAESDPLAGQVSPSNSASKISNELAVEIEALLRRGNLIAAIKLYREHTGRGLKESKDAVEAFARQRNIPLKQIGCGATALFLFLILAALGAWITLG